MCNTINNIQDDIIAEFSSITDWFDKYEYLISLGKSHKSMDTALQTEENSLTGCQSQVWLRAEIKNNRIYYFADSDSLITKGLISLLLRVVNNQCPKDIAKAELYFIDKIGLNSNLSPARVNGLMSIVKQIKSYARKAPGF